jgi:hypothetical protein
MNETNRTSPSPIIGVAIAGITLAVLLTLFTLAVVMA